MLISLLYASTSWSQVVKNYAKAGPLKGTYSSISAAFAAADETDSIVLSAHTFAERSLICFKQIVLQGTITGTDTSTINAGGIGGAIGVFSGTIRDVIITGGATSGSVNGGALGNFKGTLAGNTIVRNNHAKYNVINFVGDGVICDNVKIVNNSSGTENYSPIGTGADYTLIIRDNVLISGNNGGNAGGAIGADGIERGDSSVVKTTSRLIIEGNVRIENNEGAKAGAIWINRQARYLEINGASITNNRCTNPNFGAAITVDTGAIVGPSIPDDSIAVSYVRLNKARIYNPLPDGSRQAEIRLCNKRAKTAFTFKPGIFYSEGTWLGNSDTTGLIKKDPGTIFTMPNWSVAHWFCIPTGTGKSNVVAQMRLNTDAALPASSLKTLKGQFSATAGSFSAGTVPINSSNEMISNYTIPSSPFVVTASVDADTFRPNLKELSIKTPGFEQVKIYPNPATDVINISGAEEGSVISLIAMTGRTLTEQSVKNGNSSISVSHLSKGTYLLNLTTKDGRQGSTKVLKE